MYTSSARIGHPGPASATGSLLHTIVTCDRVAAAVAQDAGPAELTRAAAESSGKAVLLLGLDFVPLALADSTPPGGLDGWRDAAGRAPELLRTVAAERKPVRLTRPSAAAPGTWLVAPVVAAGSLRGYLVVVETSPTAELGLVAVSYLARMFGLALPGDEPEHHHGRQYRSAVLDSLVGGRFEDRATARGQARALGIADSGRFRIAVARGVTEDVLAAVPFTSVLRGTQLVMLLPEPMPSGTNDPFVALWAAQTGDATITIGLSEDALPEHAPDALRQAQYAAELGTRIGRIGKTIRYQDLGIFRLLHQVGDLQHLRAYAEDVLGMLLEYDVLHKPDLIRTLSTYLDQNGSPKQTARVLRVHVNTVSYRIQRIESLTRLDLTDPDDRLSAHVAVKIVESLPRKGNQ